MDTSTDSKRDEYSRSRFLGAAGVSIGATQLAAAFENPDYVAIVIHNYRWKLGLADGERQYDALAAKLAAGPVIGAPTITMEGDANGEPHAPAAAYRGKFSGKYEYRPITGGIGHDLPQEAPKAFAQAIVDVTRL
jgi:pimeloyl-ACP methyl ester carboxylesterase